MPELDKCQLLCGRCHKVKTKMFGESGGGHNRQDEPVHGTAWAYGPRWKCRCDPCRAAAARAKGREPAKPPEERYAKKMTAEKVIEIRSVLGESQAQLAERFEITVQTAGKIINRVTWKNI